MEKRICRLCQYPLVEIDDEGNMSWGEHAKDCPAKLVPGKPKSGRDPALNRLACGDYCKGKNGFIHDLGGISMCGNCPNADLIREGVDSQYLGKKGKKPVEIIYKPVNTKNRISNVLSEMIKRSFKK